MRLDRTCKDVNQCLYFFSDVILNLNSMHMSFSKLPALEIVGFRHRWTGRYEAHLWDNSCRREGQSRKGRQGNAK